MNTPAATASLTLCLAGDVMLGRGVDQILPDPADPALHERHMTSALGYVRLAERAHGPLPRAARLDYVWGDALHEIEHRAPDLRLVNLETAVTARGAPAPKSINYRMSPRNARALAAAGIDVCCLANNHVLDWGRQGLEDTLDTLAAMNIAAVGAGRDRAQAARAVACEAGGGARLLIVAFAAPDSGVPQAWAAQPDAPGVNLLADDPAETVARCRAALDALRRPGDIAVVSLHWGGNWGYEVPDAQRALARRLIDEAGVALVHGHSSHHPRPLEVHRGRLILYGCGDLINDYEGIAGYERYRDDLVLLYFADLSLADGALVRLSMVPYLVRKMRLVRAGHDDARWLAAALERHRLAPGHRIVVDDHAVLALEWNESGP